MDEHMHDKSTLLKKMNIGLVAFFLCSVIPMVILGFFNWPSADDLSMAYETHVKFQESGSVLAALGYAIYMGGWYYMNWIGYFFSSALTAMCPSIFGEGWYWLTSLIMLTMLTAGVMVFFKALFVKVYGFSLEFAKAVAVIVLLIMINSMPNGGIRAEAFYWYSGAINYMFMFGLGLLWLGVIFNLFTGAGDESKKPKRIARLVAVSLLGFLLGGANYMTALCLAIVSVGLIIAGVHDRTKEPILSFKVRIEVLFPAICNILGLVVSAVAPGNKVRGASVDSINPLVAIFRSVYHVFDLGINEWVRWEVLILLLFIALISARFSSGLKVRFRHPFLFSLFVLLMSAANITPPLYATGNFEAGRMEAIIYVQFILLSALLVHYITIWICQTIRKGRATAVDKDARNQIFVFMANSLLGMLFIGMLLSVYVNPRYLTGTSALYSLTSGEAATYKAENVERLEVLEDDSIKDAELKQHTAQPELLFYTDITRDPEEWVNKATATYYNKESVKLVSD